MLEYYTHLIHELGGRVKGYWVHGIAICKEEQLDTYEQKIPVLFTQEISPVMIEGYPLDSIGIVPKYQKYQSELTKEEMKDQQTGKDKELFEFIVKHI